MDKPQRWAWTSRVAGVSVSAVVLAGAGAGTGSGASASAAAAIAIAEPGLGAARTGLAGAAMSAAHASAGETSVPRAIDRIWLEPQLARLELSRAQRATIELQYADYLDRYLTARTALIEAVDPDDRRRSTFDEPIDVASERRVAARWRAIRSSLAAEDAALLRGIEAGLDERQLARIATWDAALAAARCFDAASGRGWHEGAAVDLDVLVAGLGPIASSETSEAIDATLAGWRSGRLVRARRHLEAVAGLRVRVADRLVELEREAGGDPADPSFASLAVAWDEAQADAARTAVEVGRFTRRTLESLAAILPPEQAADLRDAWRRTGAARRVLVDGPVYAWLAGAAQRSDRDGIDAETVVAIAGIRSEYRAALHRIARREADLAEAESLGPGNRRLIYQLTAEDPAAESRARTGEARAELRADRADLDARTWRAIRGLIAASGLPADDRVLPALPPEPARADPVGPPTSRSITMDDDGSLTVDLSNAPITPVLHQFGLGAGATAVAWTPQPLAAPDLDRWSAALGLEPADRVLVDVLYEDYRERWRTTRSSGSASRARRLAAGLMSPDAAGRIAMPEAADVRAIFDLRRRAATELGAVDEAFISELAGLAGLDPDRSPAIELVRLERRRVRALALAPDGEAHGADQFSARGYTGSSLDIPRGESGLDLAAIVRLALDGDPPAGAVDEALLAWARAAAPAAERRAEAAVADQLEQIVRFVDGALIDDAGRLQVSGLAIQPDDDDASASWTAANTALAMVHRGSRDTVVAAVRGAGDPAAAAAVEDRYRRAAHADVYGDPSRLHPRFRRALAREELPEDLRERLAAAWASYEEAWERTTRQIVDAGTDWNARHAAATDRRALNQSAAAQLDALLGFGPDDPPLAPAEGG